LIVLKETRSGFNYGSMEPSHALKQPLLSVSCSSSSLDGQRCLTQDCRHDQQVKETEETQDVPQINLSVDQILDQHVGGFGPAQLIHILMVSLAWAFDSMHSLIPIFTDAQPSWRCTASQTPDFTDNVTLQVSASMSRQKWCTPNSSLCEMDGNLWEWVDGRGSSVVSEWGLMCHDKFKSSIPASLFFFGCILGSGLLGRLADTSLGRKRTLMLSCFLISISGFLTAISPNIWIYSSLRLISGFGRAGIGTCSLVLSTEAVGSKRRGQVGLYGFVFFSAGFLSLPGIAYLTRSSWRMTYISISALSMAYCCFVLPFVYDSPRWLVIRRREDEALDILKKMATRNAKCLPENVRISSASAEGDKNSAPLMINLLRVPWVRRRIVAVMAAGAAVGLVYYGLPLNVRNMKVNPYTSTALNALIELPAIGVGNILLPRVDRRILISISSITCSLCCVASALFCARDSWMQMVVATIGFLAVCVAFDILFIFCLELFATNVRSAAVATMRQAIMAGAAIAPAIVVMGRTHSWVSFVTFGGFAILSGFLALLLPETRNRPLYETLQEQEVEEAKVMKSWIQEPRSP